MTEIFTAEDVIAEAKRQYGKPVSIDLIGDAMKEETLADAVQVILIDSQYWDGTHPFSDKGI